MAINNFTKFVTSLVLMLILFTVLSPAQNIIKDTPLYFTENMGQWNNEIIFKAEIPGVNLILTPNGVCYRLTRIIDDGRSGQTRKAVTLTAKLTFPGSNTGPKLTGEGLTAYKCHYLRGNDPALWQVDVPNYQSLVYDNIYPGIDLRYFSRDRRVEYDFIVVPGADPSKIKIQYEGIDSLSVNGSGELVVETAWNRITEHRPYVYQYIDNRRVTVESEYVLYGDNAFGFRLKTGYDTGQPLVIDPMISFSTYLGGGELDEGYGIAVDDSGYVYVVGSTYSENFPVLDPIQDTLTTELQYDIFVTKLNNTGNDLVFSTYLGGVADDWGRDIALDSNNNIYLTGRTHSSDFPTYNPYQSVLAGVDVFLTGLNSRGDSLVFSTYLGGSGYDEAHALALDRDGNIYITGETVSSDFPTVNPYASDQGLADAFITKFDSLGSVLLYSTYLGGDDIDRAFDIAVDSASHAYVTGLTRSFIFPIQNSIQNKNGGEEDIFVSKFDIDGDSLLFSTLLGDDSMEYGYAIALDSLDNIYIAGETKSPNLDITNGYQISLNGGSDIYLAKIDGSSYMMDYSTYLGGADDDRALDIAVNEANKVYLTGMTNSSDFPIVDPLQSYQSGSDIFMTQLNMGTNQLVYSTYLGGEDEDRAEGIAVDSIGDVYITGTSSSADLPVIDPFQMNQLSSDAFVFKITGMVCVESDGDGYGDPGHPENVCPDDNCPDIFNPDQVDADGDGVGDICDNCPDDYNPGQEDLNGNNRGDACDFPRVWYVNEAGTGDAETIQAAIDSSSHGDTVLVAAGIYTGEGNRDLDFGGRNIILLSENGQENTIIDCGGTELEPHCGIYLHTGEDSTAIIDGFTIRNGYGLTVYSASHGGGILFDSGVNSILKNCVIEFNEAENGGGICLVGCSVKIINCTIRYNTASEGGGLMSILAGDDIVLQYCAIYKNESINKGGAVSSLFSNLQMENITVCQNNESDGGDVLYGVGGAMSFSNSLLAFNTGTGQLINSASLELTCCNFFGNTDTTTYTGDSVTQLNPFFCDTSADNFHLDSLSPCVASFPLNACGVLIGAFQPLCKNLSDMDGDGIYDGIDNCLETYNPDQADINNDGVGDACCCIGVRGNANCSVMQQADISDITRLIDYLYLSHEQLCCPNEADANGSGGEPDISDITALIDHLYLSHRVQPSCP